MCSFNFLSFQLHHGHGFYLLTFRPVVIKISERMKEMDKINTVSFTSRPELPDFPTVRHANSQLNNLAAIC
jgi:hypothetical protein